jgi:hypothetical protein
MLQRWAERRVEGGDGKGDLTTVLCKAFGIDTKIPSVQYICATKNKNQGKEYEEKLHRKLKVKAHSQIGLGLYFCFLSINLLKINFHKF